MSNHTNMFQSAYRPNHSTYTSFTMTYLNINMALTLLDLSTARMLNLWKSNDYLWKEAPMTNKSKHEHCRKMETSMRTEYHWIPLYISTQSAITSQQSFLIMLDSIHWKCIIFYFSQWRPSYWRYNLRVWWTFNR